MNAAVAYLESDEYLERMRGYNPIVHETPFSSMLTTGGVVARRPMFELIDDHEQANGSDICRLCLL